MTLGWDRKCFGRPAKATVDGKEIAIESVPFPAVASKAEEDRLWLETAWVRQDDVMLADEALAYYSEQIRGDSENATLWHRRAAIQSEREDYDSVIADSTEAIRLDPSSVEGYNVRGVALSGRPVRPGNRGLQRRNSDRP